MACGWAGCGAAEGAGGGSCPQSAVEIRPKSMTDAIWIGRRRTTNIERGESMILSPCMRAGKHPREVSILTTPRLDARRINRSLHLSGRSFARKAGDCKEL